MYFVSMGILLTCRSVNTGGCRSTWTSVAEWHEPPYELWVSTATEPVFSGEAVITVNLCTTTPEK